MPPGNPDAPKVSSEIERLRLSRDALIRSLNDPRYTERLIVTLKKRGDVKPDAAIAAQIVAVASEALSNERRKGWDKLVQCTPESIQDATLSLVAMGLAPDYERKIGFFRPGWNKDRKCFEAAGIPGVRGLEMMVFATSVASNLHGAAVRRQDDFNAKQAPDGWILAHTPNFSPDETKPHEIYAAWATIGLKDGRKVTVVLPIREADLNNDVMARFRNTEAYYRAERAALRMFCRTILHDPETRAKCRNISALETYEDMSRKLGQAEEGEGIEEGAEQLKPQTPEPVVPPVAVETVPAERVMGDPIPEVADTVPDPAAVPPPGFESQSVGNPTADGAAAEPSPLRRIMDQTEKAFRPSRRRW